MENKFFTFINPYLSFIDKGHFFKKPFQWLYIIIAVANLLLPFYILNLAIKNKIFDAQFKFTIAFILLWIIIAFASWISFQLWWDRKSKINQTFDENADFVATPVFSHFIQTLGEWLGTWIGIVGFCSAILGTIILGDSGSNLGYQYGIPMGKFFGSGISYILLMPIYGFLIIVWSRFLAEIFRALPAIANNTRKTNIDKSIVSPPEKVQKVDVKEEDL
jgi:hypothetical protein